MDYLKLSEAALGLASPSRIEKVSFASKTEGGGAVEIRVTFRRDSRFACPECRVMRPAHDTHEQRWRHLSIFQYRAYIVAGIRRVGRSPRVRPCPPACNSPRDQVECPDASA